MVTGLFAFIELLPLAVKLTFVKLLVLLFGLMAWSVIVILLLLKEHG